MIFLWKNGFVIQDLRKVSASVREFDRCFICSQEKCRLYGGVRCVGRLLQGVFTVSFKS